MRVRAVVSTDLLFFKIEVIWQAELLIVTLCASGWNLPFVMTTTPAKYTFAPVEHKGVHALPKESLDALQRWFVAVGCHD
jgi:hypothetical protein